MADGGYHEHPSGLPGGVIWTRPAPSMVTTSEPPARVLPDGCIDLIWTAGRILVAGPDTMAQLVPAQVGVGYAGLRIPLAQIWPRAVTPSSRTTGVEPLEDALVAAPGLDSVGALLETLVRRRLAEAAEPRVGAS